MLRLFALSSLALVVSGLSTPVGRHSWEDNDSMLEAYAAHAGFTSEEIEEMKADQKSLFLASAHAIAVHSSKKQTGGQIPVGAQPNMFYIELNIGENNQTFRLNLDTGSSTLAIPAKACPNCGKHCNNPYELSEGARDVPCDSTDCFKYFYSPDNCGPYPKEDACGFLVQYGDGSQIEGSWVVDSVRVGNFTPVPLHIGTIYESTGSFEPFNVDGIVGVAMKRLNNNTAGLSYDTIVDSLSAHLNVPKVFSMCFGLKGGHMMFGGVDLEHMTEPPKYTPIADMSGFYTVVVDRVVMAGSWVASPHYAIVDSGTTLWYVSRSMYDSITQILRNNCGSSCSKVDSLLSSRCVEISESSLSSLPDIVVRFGTANVTVKAKDYIRPGLCTGSSKFRAFGIAVMPGGEYCGSYSSNPCIYGDIFMISQTWVFDQQRNRVGFAPRKNCDTAVGLSTCPNKDPAATLARKIIILIAVIVPVVVILLCCAIGFCIAKCCCAQPAYVPPTNRATTLVLTNPLLPNSKAIPVQPGTTDI